MQVLADINAVVDAVAVEMGEAPDEEALRLNLIARLSTLKRTVSARNVPGKYRVIARLSTLRRT